MDKEHTSYLKDQAAVSINFSDFQNWFSDLITWFQMLVRPDISSNLTVFLWFPHHFHRLERSIIFINDIRWLSAIYKQPSPHSLKWIFFLFLKWIFNYSTFIFSIPSCPQSHLDDVWSKKICRHNMIVWSLVLHSFLDDLVRIFNAHLFNYQSPPLLTPLKHMAIR